MLKSLSAIISSALLLFVLFVRSYCYYYCYYYCLIPIFFLLGDLPPTMGVIEAFLIYFAFFLFWLGPAVGIFMLVAPECPKAFSIYDIFGNSIVEFYGFFPPGSTPPPVDNSWRFSIDFSNGLFKLFKSDFDSQLSFSVSKRAVAWNWELFFSLIFFLTLSRFNFFWSNVILWWSESDLKSSNPNASSSGYLFASLTFF